jgi:hypothetical protein
MPVPRSLGVTLARNTSRARVREQVRHDEIRGRSDCTGLSQRSPPQRSDAGHMRTGHAGTAQAAQTASQFGG